MIFLLTLSMTAVACSQKSGGEAMQQKKKDGTESIEQYIKGKPYDQFAVATFAGGCFWCTEASFERIQGVKDVISGYSGGPEPNPTYQEVGSGMTQHAEAIQIFYDPKEISFEKLLEVFFVAHDPTQLNRQGPDKGPQYRSAVFYHDEEQQQQTEAYIKKLDESGKFSNPVVTEVSQYEEFWVAEDYHQDYYEQHPENPYIRNVSTPKVQKVEKTFADILKPKYKMEKGG